MLRKTKQQRAKTMGGHYAIVASRYNARYVDAMLRAARRCFAQAGAESVRLIRVPGAFEIPVVAAWLTRQMNPVYSAIVCLGVILRGETEHAQLIGEAVTDSLSHVAVTTGVPVIHEVLLLENKAQAEVRCLGTKHNRGTEAAQSALEMAATMRRL